MKHVFHYRSRDDIPAASTFLDVELIPSNEKPSQVSETEECGILEVQFHFLTLHMSINLKTISIDGPSFTKLFLQF